MDLEQRFLEESSSIGQRVRRLRKFKKLSQKELGKLSSLNDKQIRNIEQGSTNFELKTLFKIGVGLKVPIKFFFDYDDTKFEGYTSTKFLSNSFEHEQTVFGQRLGKLRESRNLDQEEFAILAKCTNSEISLIINGKVNLVFMSLLKLAAALEVDLILLFDYDSPLPPYHNFKGKLRT